MKVMTVLFGCLLACTTTHAMMGVDKDMKEMINIYNLYATCLGPEFAAGYMQSIQQACEFCEEQEVPASLIAEISEVLFSNDVDGPLLARLVRARRQADSGLSEEMKAELLSNVNEHKMEMLTKMGNFSCVLNKMGIFTEDGEVNMAQFSFEAAKEFLKDSAVGDDDDTLQVLADGYADCNEVATAWPQSTLEKNPLAKIFGRRHVFLKCMLKCQDEVCYKRQMYMGLKNFHNLDTAEVELGVPGNKFDQASALMSVMMDNASAEMKMVNDFFWTRSNM